MGKPIPDDVVYCVIDSVYYDENRMPATEFRVIRGKVKSIIHGGYTTYECAFENAGANNLRFPQLKDFGRLFFFDMDEAVKAADKICNNYDKKWEEIINQKVRRTYLLEMQQK